MRKKKIFRIISGTLCILIVLIGVFYVNIEKYLIGQAGNPTGFIGKTMVHIWNNYFTDMHQWVLDDVDFSKPLSIMDVGCGGGSNVKYVAEKNEAIHVAGVDISEDAIKIAAEVNQELIDKKRVELKVADVASLPYGDHTFDIAMALQTHIYWNDLRAGISEIRRVLKKDGTFIIACEKDKIEYYLPNYADSSAFVKFLNDLGFSQVAIKESPIWISYECKI